MGNHCLGRNRNREIAGVREIGGVCLDETTLGCRCSRATALLLCASSAAAVVAAEEADDAVCGFGISIDVASHVMSNHLV